MALSTAAQNAMLNQLGGLVAYASLHTADPGSTGTNEVSGGSPGYARKAITFGSASAGSMSMGSAVTFDIPASTTVGWVGLWSASSGGTYYGSYPLGPAGTPLVFTGDATTDVVEAPGHGYSNGQTVVVIDTVGTLPTGLSEGTIYYVINATTDTFKLSTSSGGSAIDLTGSGVGIVQRITTETYGGQGTYTLSSLAVATN